MRLSQCLVMLQHVLVPRPSPWHLCAGCHGVSHPLATFCACRWNDGSCVCGYVWVLVWQEQEQCLSHTDEYSGSHDCHMFNARSCKVVTWPSQKLSMKNCTSKETLLPRNKLGYSQVRVDRYEVLMPHRLIPGSFPHNALMRKNQVTRLGFGPTWKLPW